MIEYLKAENRILRDKLPDRITVTDRERSRLVKLGLAVGSALKSIITIVSERTFRRWVDENGEPPTAKKKSDRKPGRPRTAEDIRKLVVKIANDNGWGYTRVLGELKKLGVRGVSRSTVVNILKEAGIDRVSGTYRCRKRLSWDRANHPCCRSPRARSSARNASADCSNTITAPLPESER